MRLLSFAPLVSGVTLQPLEPHTSIARMEVGGGLPKNPFGPNVGEGKEAYYDDGEEKWRIRYTADHPEAVGLDIDALKSTYATTVKNGNYFASGYSHAACVHDEQYEVANKHGDPQKFDPENPVSIVRYDDVIAMQDREKMNPRVCYEFCRRVEHTRFFGLQNGGNCYCSTFFKASAGVSGTCDQPCEGNSAAMCGGNSQSSIFEMHSCPAPPLLNQTDMNQMAQDGKKLLGFYTGSRNCAKDVLEAGKTIEGQMNTAGNPNFSPQKKAFDQTFQSIEGQLKVFPRGDKLETALGVALGDYRNNVVNAGTLPNPAEVERMLHAVLDSYQAVQDATPLLEDLYKQCHIDFDESAYDKDYKYNCGQECIKHEHVQFFTPVKTLREEVTSHHETTAYKTQCQGTEIPGVMTVVDEPQCGHLCHVNRNCGGYQFYGKTEGGQPGSLPKHESSTDGMCLLYEKVEAITVFNQPSKECNASAQVSCRVREDNFPALKEFETKFTDLKKCFSPQADGVIYDPFSEKQNTIMSPPRSRAHP